MSAPAAPRARGAAWAAWRLLARLQRRQSPLRTAAIVLAMALGVALGAAVYLIDAAALGQFERATRRVTGDADLSVRAGAGGFDQSLFVRLARDPEVALASPELQLTLPVAQPASAADRSLRILGLDPFRAAPLQPALVGALGADLTRLLHADAIVLSHSAAAALGVAGGGALTVLAGSTPRVLHVVDVLPENAFPDVLGVMDIASAQWTLGQLGRLNRIDLRLRDGVDPARFQARLAALLPPGAVAQTPRIENRRAATATRAYRINLNMLALVALLTGAFLVFATQSLSVLQRRVALGLLRALGVTRGELQRALIGEGIAIGIAGSLLGLPLAVLIAAQVLERLGAGLGNRQLAALGAHLGLHPLALLGFAAVGTAAAVAGAWLPALEAARRPPAAALRAGDAEPVLRRLPGTLPGIVLLAGGAALAGLPPLHGVPLPGYLSIGALLLGAVLLVPALVRLVTTVIPRTGSAVIDAALAQLRGSAGSAAVSLAAVIVSFSLMVAMAIMVHSFRDSFDLWLVKLLPADLQLRLAANTDAAQLSAADQARIAALPGVARVQFVREAPLLLDPTHVPVTLIVRSIDPRDAGDVLPLVQSAPSPQVRGPAAWISEALQDTYRLSAGESLELPLGGREQRFVIAGVWRDYVHPGGAVVIPWRTYIAATGDHGATQAAIWRRPGVDVAATEAALRRVLPAAGAFDLLATEQLRERSLAAFDRAFLVTYALEAVAVLIGLAGISMAASSVALSRRAQFGMLRHLGMLRRQVLGMLACEGVLQSALAAACGLLLGTALSVILIYVINRQSFHWSIDLSVPWVALGSLSLALIAAAALTALASGRAALGQDVIRAVREDW